MTIGLIIIFGHQLVCHIGESSTFSNDVDGKEVPIPHFGIVLEWEDFDDFSEKIRSNGINFIIEPYIRFKGLQGNKKQCFLWIPLEML